LERLRQPPISTGNRHALADFRDSSWTSDLLGEDVKRRYANLKQASADRCPRLLGTLIKAQEVQHHHEVYNQYL
jgi:glutamine synthetase